MAQYVKRLNVSVVFYTRFGVLIKPNLFRALSSSAYVIVGGFCSTREEICRLKE